MGDVQRWKGNMDKAIEYYEMGLKVLPKYYGDRSYGEINPFISQLNDVLKTLAQDNERKGKYDKAIFYYENLIEIDWPSRVEGHYKTLARIFLKLGNKDRAAECYKKAKEYSQK